MGVLDLGEDVFLSALINIRYPLTGLVALGESVYGVLRLDVKGAPAGACRQCLLPLLLEVLVMSGPVAGAAVEDYDPERVPYGEQLPPLEWVLGLSSWSR